MKVISETHRAVRTKFVTTGSIPLAGRLLVPEGIIRPVFSASALILFIRYIFI